MSQHSKLKLSYAFTADQVNGKVWVSGISQKIEFGENTSRTATSGDVGLNVNAAGFGLTGYYYTGKGIGQTLQFRDGFSAFGAEKRKSEGGYIQGTYTLPGVGTKLGVSWGQSELKATGDEQEWYGVGNVQDEMWTGGIYHPITKHLNLVAEYSESERKISGAGEDAIASATGKAKTVSLGAILFF